MLIMSDRHGTKTRDWQHVAQEATYEYEFTIDRQHRAGGEVLSTKGNDSMISSRFTAHRLLLSLLPLAGGLLSCLTETGSSPATLPDPSPIAPATETPATEPVSSSSDTLRVVSFPSGVQSRVLQEQELSSLVRPWRNQQTGRVNWVLSVRAGLEQALKAEGLGVEPLATPPEYAQWDGDRQLAWDYVAKYCMYNPDSMGSAFPATNRLHPGGSPASPFTVTSSTPYNSYYLPYNSTGTVAAFDARAIQWKIFSTYTTTNPLSPDFLGGYPWDSSAPIKMVGPASSPMKLVYFELGWKTAGNFAGRTHSGPTSLIYIGANQHPREMISFEVAWRLVQRLGYSYAHGTSLSSASTADTFWQQKFDEGLHVLIVPTLNPWGYEEMTRDGGTWDTNRVDETSWIRTTANKVDLNRNWPVHWLQGGSEGREFWGTASTNSGTSGSLIAAGRKPASEPEVGALMDILQSAISRLEPNVSVAQAQRRLPVVGLDLHSAAGLMIKSSYLSPSASVSNGEAYLCGITSDCINPDEPVQSAIFGTNNRPGLIGQTGLASSAQATDDPNLPYYHGRSTANIYSSAGTIIHTLTSPRWLIHGVPRGIPAATIEMTGSLSGKTFGFGTCAPASTATAAIDEVVLDVIPTINRMAQGVISPAELPPQGTGLSLPPPNNALGQPVPTPYPTTDAIVNLGVRYEAAAQAKNWIVSADPNLFSTDNTFYQQGNCNSGVGDQCSGTWWSSYLISGLKGARDLKRYWMFAVRLPSPTSATENSSNDAEARLYSCTSATNGPCPALGSLVLLRRGSYYNLYGLAIGLAQDPPRRVTIRRRLLAGSSFTDLESKALLAAPIPLDSNLPSSGDPLDPMVTNELVLSSLLQANERVRDIRVDFPISQGIRNVPVVGVTWPFYPPRTPGGSRRIAILSPRGLDWGAQQAAGVTDAQWSDASFLYPPESQHLYTYDFDLVRAIWEQSSGQSDTDATGIAFAWKPNTDDANAHTPVVSAQVFMPRGSFASGTESSSETGEERAPTIRLTDADTSLISGSGSQR